MQQNKTQTFAFALTTTFAYILSITYRRQMAKVYVELGQYFFLDLVRKSLCGTAKQDRNY